METILNNYSDKVPRILYFSEVSMEETRQTISTVECQNFLSVVLIPSPPFNWQMISSSSYLWTWVIGQMVKLACKHLPQLWYCRDQISHFLRWFTYSPEESLSLLLSLSLNLPAPFIRISNIRPYMPSYHPFSFSYYQKGNCFLFQTWTVSVFSCGLLQSLKF